MPKQLKTGFKRIGRSGPTVDGRIIEPMQLAQAAKNYNKELFTALVWPDHLRWFNLGTVEELRTEPNNEGGIDLFAVIAPNDYYLSINNAGQRLFTSMELMPNFRDTGEWYLTGLAATDEPASAATSEMRFSSADKTAMLGQFTELTDKTFADDQPPGWFQRFTDKFSPTLHEEDAMSKQALEALTAKFTALEAKLDAVIPVTTELSATEDKSLVELTAVVAQLSEKFSSLETKLDKKPDDKTAEQFTQLSEELKALRAEFNAAVDAEHGTDGGEHTGGGENASDYI